MAFIQIILSSVITEIWMALNIDPIPPTIVNIALSDCSIATMVQGHSQGND